jgi:hypothetical protein
MQRRRIDQVLDPEFIADLEELDLDELRSRRRLARDVENELSYYRRLLHGRLDLLAFEQRRRSGEETRSMIEALAEILADLPADRTGQVRHVDTDLPPLPDIGKREIDVVLGNDALLHLDEVDGPGLAAAMESLEEMAEEISERRRQVQSVEDALSEVVARRYRESAEDVIS